MAPGGIDAPPLYFLGAVIASIENIEKKQTGNRWNHVKTTKFPAIEIMRIGGTNAVDEPTLRMILPFLKNTENKRIAIDSEGFVLDDDLNRTNERLFTPEELIEFATSRWFSCSSPGV